MPIMQLFVSFFFHTVLFLLLYCMQNIYKSNILLTSVLIQAIVPGPLVFFLLLLNFAGSLLLRILTDTYFCVSLIFLLPLNLTFLFTGEESRKSVICIFCQACMVMGHFTGNRGSSFPLQQRGELPHTAAEGKLPHTAAEGELPHTAADGELSHTAAEGELPHTAAEGDLCHTAA